MAGHRLALRPTSGTAATTLAIATEVHNRILTRPAPGISSSPESVSHHVNADLPDSAQAACSSDFHSITTKVVTTSHVLNIKAPDVFFGLVHQLAVPNEQRRALMQ
jgi:hypothetical protein